MLKSPSAPFQRVARVRVADVCLCLALFAACAPTGPAADEELHAVLAADDRRGAAVALDVLRDGLASPVPRVRAAAVRAFGRLERVEFIAEIAAVGRTDDDTAVRLSATHALAQAASTGDGALVIDRLAAVLADEEDPGVRAAAAAGLGRLRYADPAQLSRVEQLLLTTLPTQNPALAEGVARGYAALLRGHGDLRPTAATVTLLAELSAPQEGLVDPGEFGSVAATEALLTAEELRGERLQRAADSPTAEVRRIAARAYASEDIAATDPLIDAALQDDSRLVRLEALRALRGKGDIDGLCVRYTTALNDPWLAVRLAAINGLGGCPGSVATLEAIADGGWAEQGWQPAVHALASLVRLAPGDKSARVDAAATAGIWQVRMHAAGAAGETGNTDLLRTLATDMHPNVQHAALRGLQARLGHEADDVFAAALTSPDYQVVMTAANALAGGDTEYGDTEYLDEVFAALERITAQKRETSRDPRTALLRAAASLAFQGTPEQNLLVSRRLQPYTSDFDVIVAELAVDLIADTTGLDHIRGEQPLPLQPFPTFEQLQAIDRTRAVLTMDNGDRITLRFFPFEAPTHAARFVRLASDGYFDGLTFHRVVYNFVLQGGSPGANEYMGDGPFSRDEITERSHRRGTVGTSTRGRDTGDGQIFINLIDNLRLDFNYTIFAEVVDGDEALDNVAEGAVIESVTFERDD